MTNPQYPNQDGIPLPSPEQVEQAKADCMEIEQLFDHFSRGRQPGELWLYLIVLGHICFWAVFVLRFASAWQLRDYLCIWIIPLNVYLVADSWSNLLKARAWSRACKTTWVVLGPQTEFWLFQQWVVHHMVREGKISLRPDHDLGEDFATAMCDYLEGLSGWLRYRLRAEFTKIEVHAPLGTRRVLTNAKRDEILYQMHQSFVEGVHSKRWFKPWRMLMINIALLVMIWLAASGRQTTTEFSPNSLAPITKIHFPTPEVSIGIAE